MYLIVVRQGDKYGPEYPQMLRRQAKVSSGLDTLVLGDGIDADIRLERGWPGWWSKLELFRPDLEPIRPFLYVDLDSFILGDVSRLIQDKPYICREWWTNLEGVQSSVMVIAKDTCEIWDTWMEKPREWMGIAGNRGDQWFLNKFQWNYIQDNYPDYVGSYKKHNLEKPRHRIVTFHGKPKPHEVKDGWVKEEWDKWNNGA